MINALLVKHDMVDVAIRQALSFKEIEDVFKAVGLDDDHEGKVRLPLEKESILMKFAQEQSIYESSNCRIKQLID